MAFEQLKTEIIDRSAAKTWEAARQEWDLRDIYLDEHPERCLCGHYPIHEMCVIQNAKTGNIATVGNCCVNNFLGLCTDGLFPGLRRIKGDAEKSMSRELVEHARMVNWIDEWEYKFCIDTLRKRKLSEKQIAKRLKINTKVIERCLRNHIVPAGH